MLAVRAWTCYAVAPELLEADEDGYVTVKGSTIDVPEGEEETARRAAGSCPESAVALEAFLGC